MSLADKIKSRPENAGSKPASKPDTKLEVSPEEILAMKEQLDAEVKAAADLDKPKDEPKLEPELTPEQNEARTKESYEDEIIKLREENAKKRKKAQAAEEKALAAANEIFKVEREQHQLDLDEMKKQVEELKSLKKEETKLDENVKSAAASAEMELLKQQMAEIKLERDEAKAREQDRIDQAEDEKALRKKAAENRFNVMLNEIPEKFKDYATLMFKGAEDPSEGLLILSKAKANGLFGKKTIEVVNSVPDSSVNNQTNTNLSPREKRERKVQVLKERLDGRTPGSRIL